MSVPIHNLYDFIHHATKNLYMLTYFYPSGSRDLENIFLHQRDQDWIDTPGGIAVKDRFRVNGFPDEYTDWFWILAAQPTILCHDQEPLNFDLYADDLPETQKFLDWYKTRAAGLTLNPDTHNLNFRWINVTNIQRHWILLHSELNSEQVKRYEDTGLFVGAYWWSHAIIARDWYRFAEHDTSLCPKSPKKLFLAYCRDITGSREYRQNFIEQAKENNLMDQVQLGSFDQQPVGPDASAIYNVNDFNNTAISVVLETVFDHRVHLTEKILRPIACGHPFILAGGPGSLAVLQKYGFLTFAPYIDESYDDIQDGQERLTAIIAAMTKFKQLDPTAQDIALKECRAIAEYNRCRFFSADFFNQVVDELKQNVAAIPNELNLDLWWKERQWRRKQGRPPCFSGDDNYARYLLPIYRKLRQEHGK